LRLFSFGGYGLALADFGAYDSYPLSPQLTQKQLNPRKLGNQQKKITSHIGYVLDRSRAEKFDNGVDHQVISTG